MQIIRAPCVHDELGRERALQCPSASSEDTVLSANQEQELTKLDLFSMRGKKKLQDLNDVAHVI